MNTIEKIAFAFIVLMIASFMAAFITPMFSTISSKFGLACLSTGGGAFVAMLICMMISDWMSERKRK